MAEQHPEIVTISWDRCGLYADGAARGSPKSEQSAETGEDVFASAEEFAELVGNDNKRLVEIWNGIPGVTPVTKFASRKVASERIWKAIQGLGETQAAAPEPAASASDVPLEEVPAAEPVQELAPQVPSAVPQPRKCCEPAAGP